MRISATCPLCDHKALNATVELEYFEINDSGRYDIFCHNGHKTILLIQQERFQILFEIGIYALIDGYYREAVSSFTSSLERFYEFFSKVICVSMGNDWKNVQDTWKLVSNQSERQLGAFIFLHLIATNKKPHLVNNKKIEFRNEVIHKGKIPSKEQAIEYGQAVLEVIRPLLIIMREKYQGPVEEVIFQTLKQKRGEDNKGRVVSTMYKPSILSLDVIDPAHYEMSMHEIIKLFETHHPKR